MRTMPGDLEDIYLASWNMMLGIFLIISTWYLGYMSQTVPAWNAWACGGAVIVLAILALGQVYDWLEYAIAAIGLWLCAAPWLLAYDSQTAAAWTHVGFGIALMISAAAELWRVRHAPGARTI